MEMFDKLQKNSVRSRSRSRFSCLKGVDSISLAFISLTGLTTVCFSSDLCPPPWKFSLYSGTCVRFYDDNPKTWNGARQVCRESKSDLVVIQNIEQNAYLHAMIRPSKKRFWVGLNDLKVQGQYKWLDSEQHPNFLNWWENQPNIPWHQCVQINNEYGRATMDWTIDDCKEEAQYICERNLDLCPSPWIFSLHSGTCVRFYVNNPKTWNGARQVCGESKSDLVVIQNMEHNDYLHAMIRPSEEEFWVGLNDLKVQGQYKWLDSKEQPKFLNWLKNQPNVREQRCVQINNRFSRATMEWTDDYCEGKANFICERNLVCDDMKYGDICSHDCSITCKHGTNKTCHHSNGACMNGCSAGFKGTYCESICDDMKYGDLCSHDCSITCKHGNNKTCDNLNGTCLNGCSAGFKGTNCESTCSDNTYGENCNSVCRNCKAPKNGRLCDRFYGECFGGCNPGYHGSDCNSECANGTYGEDCKQLCSLNCYGTGQLCHHENGTCLHGCKSSFKGLKCYDMKGVDNTTNVYLMGFYMLVMAVLFLALVAMLLFLMVWKSLEKTQVSMEEEQPHRSSLKHVLRMKEESYISLYKITESETHFEKMETEDTLLHLKRIRSML